MATFVLTCTDRPGGLALRLKTREAHLAHMAAHRSILRLAGPLLDEAGDPVGSLLIFECETRAEVEAFAAGDPYALAELFTQVEIRPMRITVGAIA